MSNLKELKGRIGSVKSIKKITRAMQLVAASKLRRAQEAAERARPYSDAMERVIASLASGVTGADTAPPLLREPENVKARLLIVATSERGLCGGFNTNIVRLARERIAEAERHGETVKLLCVGRKGAEQLKRLHGEKIIDVIQLPANKPPSFAVAAEIGAQARTLFEAGEIEICEICYADFVNVITQRPRARRLIPAEIPEARDDAAPDIAGAVYEYEPDEEAILADLLPRNVNTQVFKALLENAAGEQGARMTAMDNSTRNAGELIDDLTLQYNRTRQANITTELTEIVAGAEAL